MSPHANALFRLSLSAALAAADEEVVSEALGVRAGRVCTGVVKRHSHPCGCDRSGPGDGRCLALSVVGSAHTHAQRTPILHPAKAVGVFLNREDLARVLLDSAVAFPNAAGFARVLECGAKVGRTLLAEGFLQDVKLFPIAAGNVDLDLDGSVDVSDGATDTAGETRTALQRRETFECHCYSGEMSVRSYEAQSG